jgi:hypothetical protein
MARKRNEKSPIRNCRCSGISTSNEGKCFDLRAMFDRLNERFFADDCVIQGGLGPETEAGQRIILSLGRSRKKIA